MTFVTNYLHCIFATKNRDPILNPKHDEELHKIITGMVENPRRKCKMLAINNVEDHMHMFVKLHPEYPLSKLMQDVKSISSNYINSK